MPRLEVALVRELESAYSSGAAPAVVEHASPYQWANACHDLWEAGRVDIAEYAVRYLHTIYPELAYLTTLVTLFDAKPRDPPAPLAFCDDPAAEIQVVRRQDCENLLLCFCAAEGTLGLPLNFIHSWLGRLPASLMYLKDVRNLSGGCGFPTLGPDRAAAIASIHRIANELGATNIYALGVSLGGYAAMHYGLELRANAVLNLAGATDLTLDFVRRLGRVPQLWFRLSRKAPDYIANLRERYASANQCPHVMMAFSSRFSDDRPQAERMIGLPNVELIPVDDPQHNVVEALIRQGHLLSVLHRLVS